MAKEAVRDIPSWVQQKTESPADIALQVQLKEVTPDEVIPVQLKVKIPDEVEVIPVQLKVKLPDEVEVIPDEVEVIPVQLKVKIPDEVEVIPVQPNEVRVTILDDVIPETIECPPSQRENWWYRRSNSLLLFFYQMVFGGSQMLPQTHIENRSSWGKEFSEFVRRQIIPSQANALVSVLLQVAFGLLTAIGSPFDLLNEGSEPSAIKIEKAFFKLLPTIMMTAVFMTILVYSIILLKLRSRYWLPAIAVLLLMVLYYFCMLWGTVKHHAISVGAKKIPGLLFTLAAALGFSLLCSTVIILFGFLSWLYVREPGSVASKQAAYVREPGSVATSS